MLLLFPEYSEQRYLVGWFYLSDNDALQGVETESTGSPGDMCTCVWHISKSFIQVYTDQHVLHYRSHIQPVIKESRE